MARLAQLPDDMVFFTQITMEAAEDTEFLDAMKAAHIKGALVGVESVTPAGLKDVYKDFNLSGEHLIERLKTFRAHGVHVLGSFIFGLPSDRPETFDATAARRDSADLTFAQFVTLSPYPGTVISIAGKKDWRPRLRPLPASRLPGAGSSRKRFGPNSIGTIRSCRRRKSARAPRPFGTTSTAWVRSGSARASSSPAAAGWLLC